MILLKKTLMDKSSSMFNPYHILSMVYSKQTLLTHWGRVKHIYFSKFSNICSDTGLVPGQCQAIIWTNARIILFVSLGTNFSEIFIKIQIFSFKKMHLKMLSLWNVGHFVLDSMC